MLKGNDGIKPSVVVRSMRNENRTIEFSEDFHELAGLITLESDDCDLVSFEELAYN